MYSTKKSFLCPRTKSPVSATLNLDDQNKLKLFAGLNEATSDKDVALAEKWCQDHKTDFNKSPTIEEAVKDATVYLRKITKDDSIELVKMI